MTDQNRRTIEQRPTARVIKVIETTFLRGEGVPPSPIRRCRAYFTMDGEFLGEVDHYWDQSPEIDRGRKSDP